MKLFQKLVEWFRKRGWFVKQYSDQPTSQNDSANPTEKSVCTHGQNDHSCKIMVLGVECEFDQLPMCPTCSEQYLNRFSTLCASCERPIVPGTPVGCAWFEAPHPFVHLTRECCDSGGLYCGKWGQGRLVTLHEINPEKYLVGTSSIIDHTFKTGGMVIENIN